MYLKKFYKIQMYQKGLFKNPLDMLKFQLNIKRKFSSYEKKNPFSQREN